MVSFFDFLKSIGFEKEQLRIEKYRLDGTNNYLISLNYSGVTWAVAIRIPAIGKSIMDFEKEKIQAVNTASYLVQNFSQGISVSKNVTFCFRGNSALVSQDSIQNFFEYQNNLTSLVEIDNITGQINYKTVSAQAFPNGIDKVKNLEDAKKAKVKKHFSEYKGKYFVSKGAPASETLDDFFDLVYEVTEALATMHSRTGLIKKVPIDKTIKLATDFDEQLNRRMHNFEFEEGTSVYESYLKHQRKRNPQNDEFITLLIKKELILRTPIGKALLNDLLINFMKELKQPKLYSSFIHNDPHCENFVIVKYLYKTIKQSHQYIDREFINEIISSIQNDYSNSKYSIEYEPQKNTLNYRKYKKDDDNNNKVNVIIPDLHYDIHLIDIDDASGVDEKSKKLHIYDLLIYALSVQNLSAIKGTPIHRDQIIKKYYQRFGDAK